MTNERSSAKGFMKMVPFQRRPTPSLLIDLSVLERDFQEFQAAFHGTRISYAVKANPHPEILARLSRLGCGFEISSLGELRILKRLGIPSSQTISSNPVKTPAFIAQAYRAGVEHFAFDSSAEVEKLAQWAPKAKLSIRLAVPNEGSQWPLDKKFGVEAEEALGLLSYAAKKGVRPWGIAFHVGSQCRNPSAWTHALEKAQQLWDESRRHGIRLRVLNVGGGVPIVYDDPAVPSFPAVARAILDARDRLFPQDTELWIEPGRAIIGSAGTMVCSVIGTAQRNGRRWVYLDAGVFQGFTEVLGGITYRFLAEAKGPLEPCVLAGPSCDSLDVIAEGVLLPLLQCGDRVLVTPCGAYTTAYSSTFNGFAGPKTLIIH